MNEIQESLARAEVMSNHLLSLSERERAQEIAKIQMEAEKNSRFQRFQLVKAEQSKGFSLTDWTAIEHDNSDPQKYFNTRVVGWDTLGRTEVATYYGNNPHCCTWSWSEDKLQPREADDWFLKSVFAPGNTIYFRQELSGFNTACGAVTTGVLLSPHIESGEWIVKYHSENGYFGPSRVLHESQMTRV